MALFSTLLSASSEEPTSTSSEIPTLIQLFTSKAITFDENAKLDQHAVLAYQALEVTPPAAEGESTLFGNKRRGKGNQVITPNLGVWNCCISKNELVDSLLTIPSSGSHYCMTVDLSDPTMVEPSLAMQHESLVRLLIQQPPPLTSNADNAATTSLSQLKTAQFGLAPQDASAAKSQAPAEADEQAKISLIVCALLAPSTKDDYKETQAQNLVLYHLRRFAAALNCTLVFCGKTDMEVPTIPLDQLAYQWREWVTGSTAIENVFAPENHQVDLIESVLLRNAQYTEEWDAAKDSLWKALPPSSMDSLDDADGKGKRNDGDDDWLSQLRDSVASVVESASAPSAAEPAASTSTESKKDDDAVSSFFEMLKK